MTKNPNDNHFKNLAQNVLLFPLNWANLVFLFILNIILYNNFIYNLKKGLFYCSFDDKMWIKKWHHTLIPHLVLLGFPPDTIRCINCNVNNIIHYSSLLESKKSISSISPGVNSFTSGKSFNDSSPKIS